jgi:replicative DNA helicase
MRHDRKFIETIELDDWQVETDTGWSDIKAIGKTVEYEEWILKTQNLELICADTHIVFIQTNDTLIPYQEIYVKDLKIGDRIITKNGIESIQECYNTYKKSNMFDLQLDDINHRFYTNDILSHNSMWLHNIATNAANAGANVLIITLEMATRKVMKRLGSMRLKIKSSEYDEKSKDSVFMKQRLNNLKSQSTIGNLFDSQPGKIFVKKYNTSDCTVTDIDNYVKKFEEVKRLKVGMIIVDYINIMSIEKGNDITSMLYLKGKHLAEGLRRIADKYECAVITATQIDKSVWGASDIKLGDIPESKAVADTADSVWGIIRNPEMKRNNIYRLKILKLRDGEHHEEQVRFDFNINFLTMDNDVLVGVK